MPTSAVSSSDILWRFRRFAGSPVSVPSSLNDEAGDDERGRLADGDSRDRLARVPSDR